MKKAFTIAEVLIVIGVIGVVATLTLPNLNRNTLDKESVTALKKAVTNLQAAFSMAKDKYGSDINAWTIMDETDAEKCTRIGTRVTEYLKVDKKCELESDKLCFSSNSINTVSGSTKNSYDSAENIYKVVLKDKTSIGFQNTDTIYVDVDGPKNGKNTIGVDIFTLNFDEDGNITYTPAHLMTAEKVTACREGNGLECASWVLNFDNNDYTRCEGLSPSKTTCK